MGIEPTCSAWKADVLPLNYTRLSIFHFALYNALLRTRRAHVLLCTLRAARLAKHLYRTKAKTLPYAALLCGLPPEARRAKGGGGDRIRTCVRVRGQIYSLLPLTTRPPLLKTRPNFYYTWLQTNVSCASAAHVLLRTLRCGSQKRLFSLRSSEIIPRFC